MVGVQGRATTRLAEPKTLGEGAALRWLWPRRVERGDSSRVKDPELDMGYGVLE